METTKGEMRYAFGKNWQRFLSSLDEERIKSAQVSLVEFLNSDNLQSKNFLDIGCGSGLFSYAAFNLSAARVVSFDYDPFSVECCRYLRQKAGEPTHWNVFQGSILDQELVRKLGQFDIVYSWGVLHHTGDMWQAIQNSAKLVKENGYYYIAIYNKVDGLLGSESWLKIKKFYNTLPQVGKSLLESAYVISFFISSMFSLRNPIRYIRNYRSMRGMDFWTDVRDWLGGYPYEFATIEEVFRFIKSNFPAFELVNLKSYNTLACNSYLFKHRESREQT